LELIITAFLSSSITPLKFLERYYPDLISKYRSLFRGSFKPPREYEDKLEERATKIRDKYNIKHRIIS
jgi:hypothetical protein